MAIIDIWIKMILRDKFAVEINFDNGEFTPGQVVEYVSAPLKNHVSRSYADPAKVSVLIEQSTERAQSIIEEYQLGIGQILKKDESEEGKVLAELVLDHCDAIISLISEGGQKRGILI